MRYNVNWYHAMKWDTIHFSDSYLAEDIEVGVGIYNSGQIFCTIFHLKT